MSRDPFTEPEADSDSHFVAYVAAQPGTVRAWRCERCHGVWPRWADIGGPCRRQIIPPAAVPSVHHTEETPPMPSDRARLAGHSLRHEGKTTDGPAKPRRRPDMPYPTDRAGRVAKRAQIRTRMVAAAEQKAREIGLSLVCAYGSGRHPSSCVGAAGCLCQCHDPKEEA